MRTLLSMIALTSLAFAAMPPGVKVYKTGDLKAKEQQLAKKIDGNRFASDTLDDFGSHYTMLAHRQSNGQAEVHAAETDLFVVESGEATLVVGGKVIGLHTVSKGQDRGTGIEGGERVALKPGDVVHIPAKVPHQLLVDSGKEFTYFVIKVRG